MYAKKKLLTRLVCTRKQCFQGSLNVHIRIVHLMIKPFACNHCCSSFGSRSYLEYPKARHKKEKDIKCTESGCTKTFKLRKVMSKHVKSAHLKTRQCNICDQPLSAREELKHMKSVHGA